ncbi:MAG: hypothetical protein HYZ15_01425 [Sphingobacteriales bacterium]|nr:hypothetical protein [Sphingobacteriales bacterium]
MPSEHVISDELLDVAMLSLARNENWVAYNEIPYFLDTGDMYFFKTSDEAHEFSDNNISEYDNFRIVHVSSIDELFRKIPYGNEVNEKLNFNSMNEKNFEYLKDQLKYHGFGEGLQSELQANLSKEAAEFTLAHKTEVNKKELEATLYFRRSDTTDMYFLNKYDVRARTERKDETLSQTFYMNKGQGVTLKEAYNLLNGRAVHKELLDKEDQKYKAWIQLDFSARDKHGNFERKQYHENYGYDIRAALAAYPIKELGTQEDKEKLLKSLEKGNLQQVTLKGEMAEIKVYVEANPQYKVVSLYDAKMQRLDQGQRRELLLKLETGETGKQQEKDKKQELGQEEQPRKKEVKASKGKEAGENKGLVTKKREAKTKGLSI